MNDACEHFAAWPVEVVRDWIADLVCGDIDFAGKMKLGPVAEFSLWDRLIEQYGSGEAVRAMIAAQESNPLHVIPLPAAGWMLLSAVAALWAVRRVGR